MLTPLSRIGKRRPAGTSKHERCFRLSVVWVRCVPSMKTCSLVWVVTSPLLFLLLLLLLLLAAAWLSSK